MGKILRRKSESNFLSYAVFSFSKSGGRTPPPIRSKLTPPLSYRPRLLAIGVVENRGKIDVKLVENMRRGYMRAARFVGN